MARGYPDFEGNKAGVYPIGYWAAREGNEVIMQQSDTDKAFQESVGATHTVTTGKTLYITDITYYAAASNAADADKNQFAALIIYAPFPTTRKLMLGGNGGGYIQLARPIKVAAGVEVQVWIFGYANHDVDIGFTVGGYEI